MPRRPEPAGPGAGLTPEARKAQLETARELFNRGEFWLAHEALETVWRSISRDRAEERLVWQGLIQACAALVHRARKNRAGLIKVGAAAVEKLAGGQHADVEFDTVRFRAQLTRALAGEGDPPRLEWRTP